MNDILIYRSIRQQNVNNIIKAMAVQFKEVVRCITFFLQRMDNLIVNWKIGIMFKGFIIKYLMTWNPSVIKYVEWVLTYFCT